MVAWKETAEMEWGIGKTVGYEPVAHQTNHIHIIVDARDDQVGELYPNAGLLHGEDSVENGLEMTATDTTVDIVAEGFQVDIGSIEVG